MRKQMNERLRGYQQIFAATDFPSAQTMLVDVLTVKSASFVSPIAPPTCPLHLDPAKCA
jgi:hypothetical protein